MTTDGSRATEPERTGPDRPDQDWESGRVEANDIELHYTRTGGDGPPLVIAHGVYDDASCRTPLLRELAAEYDVIAYDARGHGRSDAPPTGYDAETRVDDLVGLLDALDVADSILFGHSMGGDTVAATAARHPDLPRAVVMEDPAAMLEDALDDPAAVSEQIADWHDQTAAELRRSHEGIHEFVREGREELATLIAEARQRVSSNVARYFEEGRIDPEATYPSIEVPTLVLKADADPAGRERDAAVADRLPNGRLVHVEGTGHTVFRDDRATATAELRAFLADQ
jgi:pimeloyl-ACP methyl ester carboxylesterase